MPPKARSSRGSKSTPVKDEEQKSLKVPTPVGGRGKRKGSKSSTGEEVVEKKSKLSVRHGRGVGRVLTLGQGDTGQLGLGEDVMEKSRPGLVTQIEQAVDAVAGGMHTAVLDTAGAVWTFGCNDEGSLGREVAEEEECFVPGKVELGGARVVMLSAGDSHTAALTEDGEVWAWGTFRDSSGAIGLVAPMQIERAPVRVLPSVRVTKLASGSDHLALLGSQGDLWTFGNGEQGQLGRVRESASHRGGRRGLTKLLNPAQVELDRRQGRGFTDVWAGSYNTVAVTQSEEVVVMGLNNYAQLGLPLSKGLTFFMPELSSELVGPVGAGVALGQHHALCLSRAGLVASLGRQEYGRLGLGEDGADATTPTAVQDLETAVEVACGTAVSYAITEAGDCFSWGMGTNGQLGTGDEEDVYSPVKMTGKQLEGRRVTVVSSGGQHTVLIAQDREASTPSS